MAVRYLNATGTQALINEIKLRLNAKASTEDLAYTQQQLATIAATIPTKTSQLQNDSAYLTPTTMLQYAFSKEAGETVQALAEANQQTLIVLNSDKDTEGSVDYKISNLPTITQEEIEDLFV